MKPFLGPHIFNSICTGQLRLGQSYNVYKVHDHDMHVVQSRLLFVRSCKEAVEKCSKERASMLVVDPDMDLDELI
jgi:hypothetical protein